MPQWVYRLVCFGTLASIIALSSSSVCSLANLLVVGDSLNDTWGRGWEGTVRMGRSSCCPETLEVWGLVGGSGSWEFEGRLRSLGGSGSLESEGMLRSVGGRGSGRSVSERRGWREVDKSELIMLSPMNSRKLRSSRSNAVSGSREGLLCNCIYSWKIYSQRLFMKWSIKIRFYSGNKLDIVYILVQYVPYVLHLAVVSTQLQAPQANHSRMQYIGKYCTLMYTIIISYICVSRFACYMHVHVCVHVACSTIYMYMHVWAWFNTSWGGA